MLKRICFLLLFFLPYALSAQDRSLVQTLAQVANSNCHIKFPSDNQIDWFCVQIKNGQTPESIFGQNWEPVLRFNRIDRVHVRPGAYLKVPFDFRDIANLTPFPERLPRATNYPKYILISLEEQFLGAYEYGKLKFSVPVASGGGNSTPRGMFKILERDRWHRSSLYAILPAGVPYPMYWGISFYISPKSKVRFWIHSRDMPDYPASHGCVGLYDEEMQKKFHGLPQGEPRLLDAKKLYLWLFPDVEDDKSPQSYPGGLPDVLIEIK